MPSYFLQYQPKSPNQQIEHNNSLNTEQTFRVHFPTYCGLITSIHTHPFTSPLEVPMQRYSRVQGAGAGVKIGSRQAMVENVDLNQNENGKDQQR